ncbi:MAG: polysaccharide biosynthesis/export family protein [Gammaproteobacteria bacterium]|nr:polysaccharide biosynthesis/export family protein [Gammaproteobacteria bacterium]
MARKWLTLLVVMVTALVGACAGTPQSSPDRIKAALAMSETGVEQYILGPTDVVRVSVWRNPDLSVDVPVRPDGQISVPLAGDIRASGVTPEQLAESIRQRLETYIRQPQVSVIVLNMGSHEYTHRVRITGAVNGPSSIPHRAGMTVIDLVLGAGGMTDFAAGKKAVLYRVMEGEVIAIPVDLDAILRDGNIATNYSLLPGDIVTVPEKSF